MSQANSSHFPGMDSPNHWPCWVIAWRCRPGSSVRESSSALCLSWSSSEVSLPVRHPLSSPPDGILFPQFDGFSYILFIFSATPTPPSVFPLVPCCTKTGNAPPDTSLACLVTGYFPSPVEIKWNSGKVTQGPLSQIAPGLCTPEREALSYQLVPVEIFAQPSPECLLLSPPGVSNSNQHPLEVSLLPPSLKDLYIVQNTTISSLVSGMETPGSLEVSWNRGSGGPLAVVSRDPVLQEDGTYSVTSILQVCVEEWQAGEKFTCTVNINPSLFLTAVVSLRAHSVYISPPHAEELALRESATITCLASGFQPRDILVTWTQQDRSVPLEAYTNVGPVREAGKEERYFIYSKLSVLASEWERGDTYACVVGHEGLPMTFIHQSVDKASAKPTAVNVSVILSYTDITCY
uniref:Ig-like domain-containing protein n=1 Tax=Chelonoidis abingdonii TaxID=106734 RepID=A0A8C0ISR6_CHEAB